MAVAAQSRMLLPAGNPSRRLLRRFGRNRLAVACLIVIGLLAGAALVAPVVQGDPMAMRLEIDLVLRAPGRTALLGTDQAGRDVLARIAWGGRISLLVGFMAAVISSTVGLAVGGIAGFYGGKLDDVLMRVVEFFMVIPRFFLILLIIALFGRSLWHVILVIGLTIWPSTARLVRAEFLSLRGQEFVEAARALGTSDARIVLRHIAPNASYVVVVNASLQIALAILMEAALSFLGLGDPRVVSWGQMLNEAIPYLREAWWLPVFPGLAISAAVLCTNVIGDAVNDALNPRLADIA